MMRVALLIGVLVAAGPALASAAKPPSDAHLPPAGGTPTTTTPPREIGLGALQLVAGYAFEIGGVAGVFLVGLSPKDLGVGSDGTSLAMVAILAPAFAGGAVCGTGLLSNAYRGRCIPTLLGAYAGSALGALLGIAMAPGMGNPDEGAALGQAIYGVIGAFTLAPIGAVVGYHVGKEALPPRAGDGTGEGEARALMPPVTAVAERSRQLAYGDTSPHLMLPILRVRW